MKYLRTLLQLSSILPLQCLSATFSPESAFDCNTFLTHSVHLNPYHYNPYIPIETWDQIQPYFLPHNHPIKHILDKIFSENRVCFDRESFIEAGFRPLQGPRLPGNLVVGKHPALKGYLVKIYFDNQDACESFNFLRRASGAQSIRRCIQKHKYQKFFDVPKKWIYPLPLYPEPLTGPGYFPKGCILIVEDMHLLGHQDNARAFYRNITPPLLDALYTVLTEEGLIDSIYLGNIPFNEEGKITFIDTEHHHLWPVKYDCLTRYLNPEMQAYWQKLINSGPPKTQ